MLKNLKVLFIILFTSSLFSCATSIGMTVNRPADVDLHGAETIVVLPFRGDNSSSKSYYRGDSFEIRDYLRNSISSKYEESILLDAIQHSIEDEISKSTIYTVVNSKSAINKIDVGLDCPADVYITGQTTKYRTDVNKSETTKKDGDDEYIITNYSRTVSFDFRYQIIDSKSKKVLHSDNVSLYETSMNFDKISEVPEAVQMLDFKVRDTCRRIARSIEPYTETKYLTLLKGKKNEDMKIADELAKNDLIDKSYEKYISIYKKQKIFEAGYNAALILEAQGKFQEALELAEELVNKYHDKKAIYLLKDIKNEIYLANKYESQNW